MSRQKNSINNLKWGILGNIITSAVAIIIPRLFIVNYGSEVNGLLSSIRQIYVYLALLEAGVGDRLWHFMDLSGEMTVKLLMKF